MTTVGRTSTDARSVRSRTALLDAARGLVLEQGSGAITISAICQRAQVSRPTFYQHYSSPDELLADMVRSRFDDILASVPESDRDDTPAVIRRVLADIGAQPRAFAGLLGDRATWGQVRSAFEEWLTEHLAEAHPDARPSDLDFAAGGTVRLVAIALAAGSESQLDQTADDVWRLVQAVLDLP
ncbi:TetR/AcrR family transcriptional regulator [Gordonia westfalica]|uniref:DNA-binding transcriptional regulator, AcrR family n=1 Tax=Gordonia westfalica TaxID=158898 RepID=A0A1H2JF08_9ACTN|nr:TetR/AcrR family transcriptional regulator [Gordonia westfalica]SDU54979.1 DNA-binding transcriptional regulator, AcrR family [Gordonia westfalica]